MELHSEPRYSTGDQKNLETNNIAGSCPRPSTKLRDIFMSDKPSLSYADFHHQITRNLDSYLPKYSGSQQSHGIEGKAKEDELVRYMSNLPSYLEKGKNLQEKPLNVGVLDWRRLEKWKYNNNQTPPQTSGYSSSTSSKSYFYKEGSSYHSSRGQSPSPSWQRIRQCSLQSHLKASPMKTYSKDECFSGRGHSCSPAYHVVPHSHHQKVYPWEGNSQSHDLIIGNADKFEEISASIPNHRIRQQKHCGIDQTCGKNQSGVRLETCGKTESKSNTTSEIRKQQTLGNPDVVSSWKGKLKIQGSELKETLQTRAPNPGNYHPDCPKEHNTVVLLVPKDPPLNRRLAHLSDSAVSANQKPREYGRKSSSEKDNFKELHGSDMSSHVPYSCPHPPQDDSKRKSDMRESCSTNAQDVKVSSQQLKSPSRSRNNEVKKSILVLKSSSATDLSGVLDKRTGSESSSRNTEVKKSIVVLKSSSATDLSGVLDKRSGSESTTKVRQSSPIRRLGSAMGSIIRSAGSRDNSPLRRSSSKDPVAKPDLDRAAASASSDMDKLQANSRSRSSPLRRLLDPVAKPDLDRGAASASSNTDKLQANSRSRSSPLRRLLDPLMKPKVPNVHELAEPLNKESSSTDGPWKSSDEQLDLLTALSIKVKSTFISAKTKGAKDSPQNVKRGSSLQALLQVAVKNGLPLFTFAVHNDSEILAATPRKSCAAEENHSSWIYTFFTVHEMKKKNALWPNQGRKANGQYVPNVVAQMVSNPHVPVITRQKATENDVIREFTLFSVDVGQVDQHATGFQPAYELAAIVIKLLKATARSPIDMPDNLSQTSSQGYLADKRDPYSSNSSQDGHSTTSQIPLSTTVILPGDVHTIPSKGSISTLTHRWRSGGSCDCGGWDLGCQLRIFTNDGDLKKLSTSSKTTNASDEFKLFCQVGLESQVVLSLNPFKDRIYSVEFDSSISLLQAFATCVAVLDCRRPFGFLSNGNAVKERSSTALSSGDPDGMKLSNQSHGEAPASYVTYPPHSPVGRA